MISGTTIDDETTAFLQLTNCVLDFLDFSLISSKRDPNYSKTTKWLLKIAVNFFFDYGLTILIPSLMISTDRYPFLSNFFTVCNYFRVKINFMLCPKSVMF